MHLSEISITIIVLFHEAILSTGFANVKTISTINRISYSTLTLNVQPVYDEDGKLDRIGMRRLFLSTGTEKSIDSNDENDADTSPGFISSSPITNSDTSKEAISKFVMAVILFYLTLTTNLKDILTRLTQSNNINSTNSTSSSTLNLAPIQEMSNVGYIYQDVTVGEGNEVKKGDLVKIHYSVLYNGIEIYNSRTYGERERETGERERERNPLLVKVKTDEEREREREKERERERGAFIEAVSVAVQGMRTGGRRKVRVPPSLDPRERERERERKSLFPLLPIDATVLLDIYIL